MAQPMKICVFTYDHEHAKTAQGLSAMWLHGFEPAVVWAAPWRDLGKSFDFCYHPSVYAARLGADYVVETHKKPIEHGCFVGVVLGAKILPQSVIDTFPCGIINIHPGRIPENGGLKSYELEWNLRGSGMVTAHFIDKRIDRGYKILERDVARYSGDTFENFVSRMNAEQMPALIDAIRAARGMFSSGRDYKKLFKRVP
jgi:hypothetical protein